MLHELQRLLNFGKAVELIYIDHTNTISKRNVKLISINQDFVHAYCYSRRAPRSFRIQNILAVGMVSKIKRIPS